MSEINQFNPLQSLCDNGDLKDFIEDLKCCLNCSEPNEGCELDNDINVNYCKNWQFDGLTQKERMG